MLTSTACINCFVIWPFLAVWQQWQKWCWSVLALSQAICNKQQLILANIRIGKNLLQPVSSNQRRPNPACILYKSTSGRYRPVSYPDRPITARYWFIKNAYWEVRCIHKKYAFVRCTPSMLPLFKTMDFKINFDLVNIFFSLALNQVCFCIYGVHHKENRWYRVRQMISYFRQHDFPRSVVFLAMTRYC